MAERIAYAGIDHVQLAMPAGREGDARRFYKDVLDFIETDKPAGLADRGGCWFLSTSGRVHLHLGVDPDFRPAAKAHPAFLVSAFDAVRRRLREAGVEVVDDDAIPGVRRFYTADPFGNRLEFIAEADRGFTSPDRGGPGGSWAVPVRRATPADADAIADVHVRSWSVAYARLLPSQLVADMVAGRDRRAEAFRRLLTESDSPQRIWVAGHPGAVVGMAVWSPGRDDDATETTADVEAIYLDPSAIGQGIGQRLFAAVAEEIERAGFTDATLWVLETNDRARRFYEAAGWQPDGAAKVVQRPAGELHEVRYRRMRGASRGMGIIAETFRL